MSALGVLSKIAVGRLKKSGAKASKKSPAPVLEKGVFDRLVGKESEFFTVGFAKTDIMPSDLDKKKYYVAGYKPNNPATGSLDPMTASAVWIDDNSGRGGVVFVSADDVGLLSHDVRLIKAELADFVKRTGCRSINIMSTHNHAGIDTMGYWGPLPKTGRDESYMKILRDGVKKVVEQAYDDRRDGSLYFGWKEAPEVQRDSRLPEVFCKKIYRIRFAPNDGGREIYILNFASHTESLLGKNSLVSADFAAYIRKEILDTCGAESIYFVGAIGGLIRLKELDEDNIKSTMLGGKLLGQAAMAVDNEQKLPVRIDFIRQEFYVPADNYVLLLAAKIGIFKTEKYANGEGSFGYALRTEMTYFEVGGLKMLLLPGEIFPELVYGGYLPAAQTAEEKSPDLNPKPLAQVVGDENLLIFGLANDEIGYIVTPNDFYLHPEEPFISGVKDRLGRGHYEETNSLGSTTAARVAGVFDEILQAVSAAKAESEKA